MRFAGGGGAGQLSGCHACWETDMSLVPDGMRSDVTMAMPLRAVCETSMCGCACTCCDRNEAALAEHGEQRRVRATERNDDAKGLKSRMTCGGRLSARTDGTD